MVRATDIASGFQPNSTIANPARGLTEKQDSFSSVMSRSSSSGNAAQDARGAAEDLVAIAFVQPVLKMLRETNGAAGPFAPGNAERQMSGIADAQTSRRLVRASGWPLVDRIADQIRERSGGAAR
jgi:Rod binding domain-containing protein